MSAPNLPVNFKDDVLASSNTKRKYQQTYNSDGSISLEDVTAYSQKGSEFGASQINQTNKAINDIYNERIQNISNLGLVTESGFFVDALVIKALLENFSTLYGDGALFQVHPAQNNIVYGCWEPGIYYFDGETDGAPIAGWDGVMLTFRRSGTSNMIKVAFSTDGSIHRMVQRSNGEIAQAWRSVW